jgi:hypothetical protein
MAEYKLLRTGDGVQRLSDGAFIPNAPGNRDWTEYQEWLARGGVPDEAETLEEKRARRIIEIKAKASQVILMSFPEWKQRNMTARAIELTHMSTLAPLTPAYQDELDDLISKWQWVKSIRDASNVAEAAVMVSTDPDSVAFDPAPHA